MADDAKTILRQLARVVETICADGSTGVDCRPLFQSEAKPLIAKLKHISGGWPGSDNFHEKIDELQWSMEALAGLNDGNGQPRTQHEAWAKGILDTLRHIMEEDGADDQTGQVSQVVGGQAMMTNAEWTNRVIAAIAQMPGFLRLRVTWKIVGRGFASSERFYARPVGSSLHELLSGIEVPDRLSDLEIVAWGFIPAAQSSPADLMLVATKLLTGVDADNVDVHSHDEGHGESIYRITIIPGKDFAPPSGRV